MLDIKQYLEMLKYKRPTNSSTELLFIKKFIDIIPNMQKDEYGNRYIVVGEEPTTMFSCHTDTVHTEGGFQKLQIDWDFGLVKTKKSNCLGADDTSGIYIMLNMIDQKVPGLYVFHREEEAGGGGSIFFATTMIRGFKEIKRCIAFDRKGFNEVITHQGAERCCSETFANALALELGKAWTGDDSGSFTDSANYVEVIPECTNISVGYTNQHTIHESQDIFFLDEMLKICLSLDWEGLPTERDPSVVEYLDWGTAYGANSRYYQDTYDDTPEYLQSYEDVEDYVYSDPTSAVQLICDLLNIRYDDRRTNIL